MSESYNSFRWMKLNNQRKVLQLLHQHKRISRVEIARQANLQKQTVTNIIQELIEERLVVEESVMAVTGVGRKPVLLSLNSENLLALGLEVNKSYLTGMVMNYNQHILYRKTMNTFGLDGNAMAECLLTLIDELMQAVPTGKRVVGIGIGVQGIIDSRQGEVILSPYLGWHELKLKQLVEDRFELSVYIDNNVRAFARGVVWARSGEQLRNALCLYLDESVGGALVIDGEIYTGDRNSAGEIGHVKTGVGGRLCFCGQRGCLEAYVSIRSIIDEIGLPFESGLIHVIKLLEEGHKRAIATLQQVGRQLGFVLGNSLNLLNPADIILGGELVKLAPWFEESLKSSIKETARKGVSGTPITWSDYSVYNCSAGSAALAFHCGLLQLDSNTVLLD